ncbi:hypothetical protein SISSUDRAFT_592673, partial [Sistotremastrum suecicum HHB10207 ss-3]
LPFRLREFIGNGNTKIIICLRARLCYDSPPPHPIFRLAFVLRSPSPRNCGEDNPFISPGYPATYPTIGLFCRYYLTCRKVKQKSWDIGNATASEIPARLTANGDVVWDWGLQLRLLVTLSSTSPLVVSLHLGILTFTRYKVCAQTGPPHGVVTKLLIMGTRLYEKRTRHCGL